MIVAIHVMIALLSIVLTTVGYFRPTSSFIRAGYVFIGLTFISGFFLVWSEPAQILHTCLSGLAYLAVVSVGVLATRRKYMLLQSEQS